MLKDFLLVRNSPSVKKQELQQYLQFNHAPLALSTVEIGRSMQRYTMNHLVDDDVHEICLYDTPGNLTTIVEHLLAGGAEKVQTLMADAEYIEKVVPDEQHMIQNLMEGMPQFVAVDKEEQIFDKNGKSSMRMFEFIRRSSDVSQEQFLHMLHKEGEWAGQEELYSLAVEKRVHSIVGSGPLPVGAKEENPSRDFEPFDAVIEVWINNPESLSRLSSEILRIREQYCDNDRSISAVTNENKIR